MFNFEIIIAIHSDIRNRIPSPAQFSSILTACKAAVPHQDDVDVVMDIVRLQISHHHRLI